MITIPLQHPQPASMGLASPSIVNHRNHHISNARDRLSLTGIQTLWRASAAAAIGTSPGESGLGKAVTV